MWYDHVPLAFVADVFVVIVVVTATVVAGAVILEIL